jgi:hypothetical protein
MGAILMTTFYCVVFLILLRIVGPPLFRFFKVYLWPYLVRFARWWWEWQKEEAWRRRMAARSSPAPQLISPERVNDRTRDVVEVERRQRAVSFLDEEESGPLERRFCYPSCESALSLRSRHA